VGECARHDGTGSVYFRLRHLSRHADRWLTLPLAPGRIPHRPAARRGRTRLRAPDRGSGKDRRRRPGWPIWGWCLRRTAAAPLTWRTRPALTARRRHHLCPGADRAAAPPRLVRAVPGALSRNGLDWTTVLVGSTIPRLGWRKQPCPECWAAGVPCQECPPPGTFACRGADDWRQGPH
jgi:hypothetical protein